MKTLKLIAYDCANNCIASRSVTFEGYRSFLTCLSEVFSDIEKQSNLFEVGEVFRLMFSIYGETSNKTYSQGIVSHFAFVKGSFYSISPDVFRAVFQSIVEDA